MAHLPRIFTSLGLKKAIIEYSNSNSFLRLRYAIFLFFGSLTLGTSWYFFMEGFTIVEAFYMTVITISTVGFTELRPLGTSGQIFTSIFIILNIGIFAYSLSAFSYYVIQGEIFKKINMSYMEKAINDLENHIIICGYGRYGKEVAENFIKHKLPFVIIEQSHDAIEEIVEHPSRILYLEGDATHDEILITAGIKRASAIIAALADDADNVFTVLTSRQLNPKLNIISRAYQNKSIKKLRLAGADHVIMPELIGGFYMATLVTKPNAVEFFSFITNEHVSDIGFEEVSFEQLPGHCKGKSIKDLHIRSETGTNIIGFQTPDGRYVVNPTPETVLAPGSSFIVIGNAEQLKLFRTNFKNADDNV
ncbi:MAG: NAD-binding protein [Saprospiraceae bacterium]|nr:NAD-binding protein [Saprospiraceae bacterium]